MTLRDRINRSAVFLAAGLLAVLVGSLLWLPARLVVGLLPAPFHCAAAAGTAWRGRCDGLRSGAAPMGALSWRLRALPLLRLHAVAEIEWSYAGSRLTTAVDLSSDRLTLQDLRGVVDLTTVRSLPVLPPDLVAAWAPGEGRLRLDIAAFELVGGRPVRLVGVIDADGLVALGRERWVLGDYRLVWREGTAPRGELTDRGGPLALRASLSPLDLGPAAAPPGGAWRLLGEVRARDPAWAPRLGAFGPADASGQHRLSIDWR